MIRIEYGSGGELVSDFCVQSFMDMIISKIKNDNDMNWIVSNSLPINVVKMLIAEGKVPHEKVVFVFEGKEIYPNEYGAIQHPKGFCDIGLDVAERTLIAVMKKRRTKGKNNDGFYAR